VLSPSIGRRGRISCFCSCACCYSALLPRTCTRTQPAVTLLSPKGPKLSVEGIRVTVASLSGYPKRLLPTAAGGFKAWLASADFVCVFSSVSTSVIKRTASLAHLLLAQGKEGSKSSAWGNVAMNRTAQEGHLQHLDPILGVSAACRRIRLMYLLKHVGAGAEAAQLPV
jgi:hypothetical protein